MRKKVKVNEMLLQEIIAGNNSREPIENTSQKEVIRDDIPHEKEDIIEEKEISRPGRKKKEQPGYEELYLSYRAIDKYNRQQINIDGELYEKMARFVKVAGSRRMSMTSYVNNILSRHWEDNKEVITELYERNMTKPL